ncbi:hypothetical protein D1610_08420 [Sphingomonas gilva]|uniref:Flagellar FliJ protein n=1 Tax=Sphingomonas gilva TaxID=2305907 RepID=A0A396RPK2_9SPHN|nr:hypothetical protein [Sphingomonas gilva]RHW18460.1 hypothetical protein D1610_08420 [Sphingomonas gilva]
MKVAVQRRERISRARQVQHLQAAAQAAQAEGLVAHLKAQSSQIAHLSTSMTPAPGGATRAVTLSNTGELAMRLREAHVQLSRALSEAQVKAAERSAERVEARIREESARQLVDRARAALEELYDRRMAALALRRRIAGTEE